MKKGIVLLIVLFGIFSCAKKSETQEPTPIVDSVKTPIVGSDQDQHGCKTSAGYTWSNLRKECVRIFEVGERLDSSQKDTMSAFVIFDATENKAELFTILEKEPLILERKNKNLPWSNGDWQLSKSKGLILKKGNQILFSGK